MAWCTLLLMFAKIRLVDSDLVVDIFLIGRGVYDEVLSPICYPRQGEPVTPGTSWPRTDRKSLRAQRCPENWDLSLSRLGRPLTYPPFEKSFPVWQGYWAIFQV